MPKKNFFQIVPTFTGLSPYYTLCNLYLNTNSVYEFHLNAYNLSIPTYPVTNRNIYNNILKLR